MTEALSSWTTWALLLGGWAVASVGCALVMGKFFRRAQGKHALGRTIHEVSEEAERTSVVPAGFFADFVDQPSQSSDVGSRSEIFESAPRVSGTRYRAVDSETAAESPRKQA